MDRSRWIAAGTLEDLEQYRTWGWAARAGGPDDKIDNVRPGYTLEEMLPEPDGIPRRVSVVRLGAGHSRKRSSLWLIGYPSADDPRIGRPIEIYSGCRSQT
jgi:hypothetical protein